MISDSPSDAPIAPPAAGSAAGDPGVQPPGHDHGKGSSVAALAFGAIGIVFGDIGTSPIYAFRETFAGHHPLTPDAEHIFGVVSLIFWSMTLVVGVQYVSILMRADNKRLIKERNRALKGAALMTRGRQNKKSRITAPTAAIGSLRDQPLVEENKMLRRLRQSRALPAPREPKQSRGSTRSRHRAVTKIVPSPATPGAKQSAQTRTNDQC